MKTVSYTYAKLLLIKKQRQKMSRNAQRNYLQCLTLLHIEFANMKSFVARTTSLLCRKTVNEMDIGKPVYNNPFSCLSVLFCYVLLFKNESDS